MEEQKEIEKLRRSSTIGRQASWEYDGKTRQFTVSKAWEDLTGYDAKEVFPALTDSYVQIEDLFDNLIEDWLGLVAESDRAAVRKKATEFLIYRSTNNCITLDYRLLRKDGTERIVQTSACSVWDGPKLVSLFVQTEDLNSLVNRYLKPEKAAEAIVQSQCEIKDNSNHIKNG